MAMVKNIKLVGLKRPITVRRSPHIAETLFDLICGEGRLDAFRMLGESDIPAVIIEADDKTCLVMSLVANIARYHHRPIESVRDVGRLHRRGYTVLEISEKIGHSADWVEMVVRLLARGEERVLSAALTGRIPASLAAEIALGKPSHAQSALLNACKGGKVRGKSLAAARLLLEPPRRPSAHRVVGRGPSAKAWRLSPANLIKLYELEIEKRQVHIEKFCDVENQLLLAVETLTNLLSNDSFSTLLQGEGLTSIPGVLASRIKRGAAT
jgi:ParB family chromosome partitioning protein